MPDSPVLPASDPRALAAEAPTTASAPATSLRPRIVRALIWTAISTVLGLAALFFLVGIDWPTIEEAGADSSGYSFELLVHIVLGGIALVCLPFVLAIDGRVVPRRALRPRHRAAEQLRDYLTTSGRGGPDFLAHDDSVASLMRRTGGALPITLGLIGIIAGGIGTVGSIASVIILGSLTARHSWATSIAAALAAIAGYSTALFVTPRSTDGFVWSTSIATVLLMIAVAVIGAIRGAREQGELDAAAQTLLRERSRQDRAIAEVRRGIARDMHDSLSHHLSVIAMYAGALSVRRDLDPDSVRDSARLIAQSARRSGAELREVLTMLRGDEAGTVLDPDLDRLVAGYPDAVDLRYIPPLTADALTRIGSLERTTIYRFAQEAMTNAFKHARGRRLSITLACSEPDEGASSEHVLVMTAANPLAPSADASATSRSTASSPAVAPVTGSLPTVSPAPAEAIPGSGLGLLGLRERVESMGGTLAVTRDSEFELRAILPIARFAPEAEGSPACPVSSAERSPDEVTEESDS